MAEFSPDDPHIAEQIESAHKVIERILEEVGRHVVGQDRLRRRLLTALIAQGHILLEGVPGLAKTLSIKALASSINASFQRIQFTPDLLPGDIIGTEIYRPNTGEFTVRKGPVFAHFLLADEINRAPAKVQSALLEAMQERQVTIGDTTLKIPDPFFVLATQNPIEQEGTYPLPEAQVDRFMMKVLVDYPEKKDEREMLDRLARGEDKAPHTAVSTIEEIASLNKTCQLVYVDERIRQYIVDLVRCSREPALYGLSLENYIELGASPRAVLSLFETARAEALISGAHYVLPQMVKDVAKDVLRHRIILTYEAEARGVTIDSIIEQILEGVEVP